MSQQEDEAAAQPAEALQHLLTVQLEVTFAVLAAAKLGLPDALSEGPMAVDELARRTNTHPPSLLRMLRALTSFELVEEDTEGRFCLTGMAEALAADAPNSMTRQALWTASEEYLRTWSALADSVRTGRPAFEQIYGQPFFDYLPHNPRLAKAFNDVMSASSADQDIDAVISLHDFARFNTIVDVGGGRGTLLASILHRYADLVGVLYDSPQVVATTEASFDELVAARRASKVAGDFFDSVPPGGDAYILKFIVHDWDDEPAITILRNCRDAMTPDGSVLLVEVVRSEAKQSEAVSRLDLTMLLFLHGRERSEAEYAELLAKAGLQLVNVTGTASRFSVLEAVAI